MRLILNGARWLAVILTIYWTAGFVLASDLAKVNGAQSLPQIATGAIYTFDARPLNQLDLHDRTQSAKIWDTLHLLAALQGLVNQERPQFYLFYCHEFGVETDEFWFDWLRHDDGWLSQAQVTPLASIEAVLNTFRSAFAGLVVYDPKVPATSNLASTAAGVDRLLPVRYDSNPGSLFSLLTLQLKLPVKLWFVHPDGTSKFTGHGTIPDDSVRSSGSAKVDAYRWGIKRYLETGRCDPRTAAYYIDAFWLTKPERCQAEMHTLSNHDYFIAHRAFFFDLSPWSDETPNDDPHQPLGLDRQAFLEVLQALAKPAGNRLIKIGGFPPWPFKYTSHSSPAGRHEGVPTEWEFGRLLSQYNAYMEADAAGLAGMANASFFQHYPLADRYRQPNAKPGPEQWRRQGYLTAEGKVAPKLYVGHYVGDYDAPSWLYKAVPVFFRDPARGQVPLGWAFNPNLCDRAPQALAYAYRYASTNDYFIAGDSGAGYLNVRALTVRPESGLTSGLDFWKDHCQRYYHRWDMSISGFVLDGAAGAATELEFQGYRSFSPDGIGTHFEKGPRLYAGVPTCPERDLPDRVDQAVEVIAGKSKEVRQSPRFLWARSILKSPGWYAQLSQRLQKQYPQAPVAVVDPYTFFGLIFSEAQTQTGKGQKNSRITE